jgi:aryl-alcohol dehydrogenase-like predicted oxidoreductase
MPGGGVSGHEEDVSGATDLRVSELCLGTMTFGTDWGWGADEATCRAIFDEFDERGGTFVDSADRYTDSSSEQILGRLLAGQRERFVLATNYTLASGEGRTARATDAKNLRRSLDASLQRLRTEYVDVLWVHMYDGVTPIEETVRALDDAVRAGKVLHVGFLDFPAWLVARADALAETRGLTRPAAIQVEHNLARRDAERELLPMADALGLSVCAWSPLGGGALIIGRASLSRAGGGHFDAYADERTSRAATVIAEVAGELGRTPAQVAIAWCRAWSPLAVPVVGAHGRAGAREPRRGRGRPARRRARAAGRGGAGRPWLPARVPAR